MKKIICLLFLFIFSLVFISCDENNPVIDDPVIDDIYYEVSFIVDEEVIDTIKVKESTKVTKPVDPEKDGFEFIGWFTDDTLYDFNSLVTKDITIIAKFIELKPMLEINVLDNKLNIGYSTQINAKFYDTEEVSLEYKVDQKGIVYIDDKGVVTALRPGVVKITAYTESLVSNEIEIEVLDEIINEEDKIDLKGYTIKHNYSLFDKEYLLNSKYEEHQELYEYILKIEEKYNCKLEYQTYFGNYSDADMVVTPYALNPINEDKINCITDLFYKYRDRYSLYFEDNTLSNVLKNEEIFFLPSSYVYGQSRFRGIYYDLEIIKELGLADPLSLYLEGKWTYSNFIAWCEEAKSKLDEKQNEFNNSRNFYVISGYQHAFYQGLINTVGIKIVDNLNKKVNFNSDNSYAIIDFINDLLNKEIYINGYHKSILNVDNYDINYDYFSTEINYRLETLGLVPYPYPDDYNPNDVYYNIDISSKLLFTNFNVDKYPNGVNFEDIFVVICDILYYKFRLFNGYYKSLNGIQELIKSEYDKANDLYVNISHDKYIYDHVINIDNYYVAIDFFIDNKNLNSDSVFIEKFINDLKNYNIELN